MNKAPSSDEDDASFCTPELAKVAEDLRGDLLRANSCEKYKAVYEAFIQWKSANVFYLQIFFIYKSIYLQVLFYLQINVKNFRSYWFLA